MSAQFCAWEDEDGEPICSRLAIVGFGPSSTPLCLDHLEAALRQLRLNLDGFLFRLDREP